MEYFELATIPPSLLGVEIVPFFPEVTDDDKKRGYIVRYFTRQTNHRTGEITEIDEKTATKLKANSLYKVVSLEWKISGKLDDIAGPRIGNSPTRLYTGVLTANRVSLEDADKEMPGMRHLIFDLTQFWLGDF
jgi:hypothetical protein